MEPRIQYAQTADGVSIAYWTSGKGMPLVVMPMIPFSHLEREWQFPELRSPLEHQLERRTIVRYDNRGSGLSHRDVTDYSLAAHLLDLEAVVDRMDLETFALFGYYFAGPVAIAYAARHPERVSHLILWNTATRISDSLRLPQFQAVAALMDKDWETFTETLAHSTIGWSEGEWARWFAAYTRESITQDAMQAAWAAGSQFDVSDSLPDVKVPTLVVHRRQVPFPDVDHARKLASRIPDARLAVLEGQSPSRLVDMEQLVAAINEFLSDGEESAAKAEPPEAGAFRTILFTDVEGSTALTERLGDAKARELLREHERMVREALKAHGGSEVKALGDGFMTSFSSATRALECAIAMQRAFADWNAGVGAALAPPQGAASDAPTAPTATEPLHVRIGLNAGEPIAEDDPAGRSDLYGTAVNLAARIAGKAKGGEIFASDVVQGLVAGKRFEFVDRGKRKLRGFDATVRLYEVRWRGDA